MADDPEWRRKIEAEARLEGKTDDPVEQRATLRAELEALIAAQLTGAPDYEAVYRTVRSIGDLELLEQLVAAAQGDPGLAVETLRAIGGPPTPEEEKKEEVPAVASAVAVVPVDGGGGGSDPPVTGGGSGSGVVPTATTGGATGSGEEVPVPRAMMLDALDNAVQFLAGNHNRPIAEIDAAVDRMSDAQLFHALKGAHMGEQMDRLWTSIQALPAPEMTDEQRVRAFIQTRPDSELPPCTFSHLRRAEVGEVAQLLRVDAIDAALEILNAAHEEAHAGQAMGLVLAARLAQVRAALYGVPVELGGLGGMSFGGGFGSGGDEEPELRALLQRTLEQASGACPSKPRVMPTAQATAEQMAACDTCTICQCAWEGDDKPLVLECEHVFHKECLGPWFKSNETCPTCRAKPK